MDVAIIYKIKICKIHLTLKIFLYFFCVDFTVSFYDIIQKIENTVVLIFENQFKIYFT